jgi:hypothetical protein
MSEIGGDNNETLLRPHNPVLPNNRFDVIAACRAPRLPSDPAGVDYYFVAWTPTREPDQTLLLEAEALTRLGHNCVEVEHRELNNDRDAQRLARYRSRQLGLTTKDYFTRLYRAANSYFRSLTSCGVQLCRPRVALRLRRSLELDFPGWVTTYTTSVSLGWLEPSTDLPRILVAGPAEHPPVAAP